MITSNLNNNNKTTQLNSILFKVIIYITVKSKIYEMKPIQFIMKSFDSNEKKIGIYHWIFSYKS